jgi:N-carbamoylputrescine amidase
MRQVTLAATQMACGKDRAESLARAEKLIRQAAAQGANIILIQELFETPYFCQDQLPEYFELARPVAGNEGIAKFSADAGGAMLGVYRKTHIPDGVGYQEKYYFNPGDTGFRVWDTKFGKVGLGICWDQWFPETARCLVLGGAEVLLYPTAIGTEPQFPDWDSSGQWQRAMQGHAASNMVPVVASNRIGTEKGKNSEMTFYGSSFITDETGAKVAEADRASESVLTHTFDLDAIRNQRAQWGFFRDRRPEHYGALVTLAGEWGGL